jgi:hypothetical protein
MSKNEGLPYMFRGSKRIYRVVGVQGDNTILGINMSITTDKICELELAFACLGQISKQSPFTIRESHTHFLVAYSDKPESKCPLMRGQRLNKIVIPTGKELSVFEHMAHIEANFTLLKEWLDATLDSAGVVPAYNDVSDVFQFFFGTHENQNLEKFPIELKPLGEYNCDNLEVFDAKKYMKDSNNKNGDPDDLDEEEDKEE